MPRQRSGGRPSAPSRPSAPAPPARAPQQQQQRPMSTVPATRPQQGVAQQAPPAQAGSAGPGLFGQMASTAAGVAVGSSIGHAIGGWFGGGSSAAPAPEQQQQAQDHYSQPVDSYAQPGQSMDSGVYNATGARPQVSEQCAGDLKTFTQCMNQNYGNMDACSYYFEQLKACQRMAQNY